MVKRRYYKEKYARTNEVWFGERRGIWNKAVEPRSQTGREIGAGYEASGFSGSDGGSRTKKDKHQAMLIDIANRKDGGVGKGGRDVT